MTIKRLLTLLASNSAISDRTKLLEIINLAAVELWNHADYPGILEETMFKPSSTDHIVTFPNFVQHIRGVRLSHSESYELWSRSHAYDIHVYEQTPFTWDVLSESPQKKDIVNASTLLITRPTAGSEISIQVAGETDTANSDGESVVFTLDDKQALTTKRYKFLDLFSKDEGTSYDLTAFDASGNEISTLYADQLEALFLQVRIRSDCHSCDCSDCNCFKVLYKPRLPYFFADFQSILPEPLALAIYYRCRALMGLDKATETDPGVFYEQSRAVYHNSAADWMNGKRIPLKTRRRPYPMVGSGNL